MRETSKISELRAALRRQGVWGARAERLLQDWTEHAREETARRIENGAEVQAAQEAAWAALGGPDVLAAAAGRELANASWLGRHPWLGGLVLPGLSWVAVVAAVIGGIALLARPGADALSSDRLFTLLSCWQQVFNWLPWVLSVAWLGRIAARMPGGWKLFWVTAVVLTLCSTSLHMAVTPPSHGQGSGMLMINTSGILGIVAMAIVHVLGLGATFGSWDQVVHVSQVVSWIQTGLMILGVMAFRTKAMSDRKVTGATLDG